VVVVAVIVVVVVMFHALQIHAGGGATQNNLSPRLPVIR
jgi:hypothetical protein